MNGRPGRRRVGVNLCWLVPGVVGGTEAATIRLLDAIHDAQPQDLELVLFGLDRLVEAYPALTERFETHTAPVSGTRKPVRVAAEMLWLPRAVRRHGIDLMHDAGGTSPGSIDLPRVLTIHDIQPLDLPANFSPPKVAYLREAIPSAVRGAARIVVPSTFVRDRLVAALGADPARIDVVAWSTPTDTVPETGVAGTGSTGGGHADAVIRAKWALPGPVLFLPAITYPHKNHVTAIRAVGRLVERHPDLRLVLVGGEGPAERSVHAEIAALGLTHSVLRAGQVPRRAVDELFRVADVVAFPSIYEGFGLPALEAMASGTPVVVADAGALPEVVGDAGIVVAPDDDAQWAVEIHIVLDSADHRAELVARGRARAGIFSPERTAESMLAAYRSILDER